MENFKKIPVILDGDPGHDDAIAWVVANASPLLDIRAVTTVCGNQTLEKTTYNARRICTLIGLDAPIAMGRPRPLFTDPMVAPNVHGQTGLDGPVLPEPRMDVQDISAVELMARILRESDEKITLIPTGPLTTIASLLMTHPELKDKIAHIYMMGGGIAYGNWTPAAEFNILVDPEAADIVFSSGLPITMAGLDVTEKALVFPEDFARVKAVGGKVAEVVAEWLEFFYIFHKNKGYTGAPVHDAVAVAALIKPEIMQFMDMHVDIETYGEFCKGTTVGDIMGVTGRDPNARVILGIDREAFVELIIDSVRTYGEEA